MALDYPTYVNQLANMLVIGSTDPNFLTFLPGCIDYAEQRIYRELDPLGVRIFDTTTVTTSGNRSVILSTLPGTFITIEMVGVDTPSGSSAAQTPLIPVSQEFLRAAYPASSFTGVPEYYAVRDTISLSVGPVPDAVYNIFIFGTVRPNPLSASNPSTLLTRYIPDVFMAASLVFGFGYMRDFGGQTDNPQASQSWETQYQLLMKSAAVEQYRAKQESQAWSAKSPPALVQRKE